MNIRQYQETDREAVLNLHKLALAVGTFSSGRWDSDLEHITETYLTKEGSF
jgi:hypothetical protein